MVSLGVSARWSEVEVDGARVEVEGGAATGSSPAMRPPQGRHVTPHPSLARVTINESPTLGAAGSDGPEGMRLRLRGADAGSNIGTYYPLAARRRQGGRSPGGTVRRSHPRCRESWPRIAGKARS